MTDSAAYQLALNSIPNLVWMSGLDGSVTYLNRRAAEFFRLPVDDLLGWDWAWVVHPADLPAGLAAWSEAVRSGSPFEFEGRFRRHDGQYRWFLARAEPVRDADGRVVRWFGTCTDIDDSKRLTDQLRAVRSLFRPLVERSEDGLALVGADGATRYANPAAGRLLGCPADELIGAELWGRVHPSDRREVAAWLARVTDNPGTRLAATVRFIRRDGETCWLEVLGTSLLPDPDARAVSVQLRALDEPRQGDGGG